MNSLKLNFYCALAFLVALVLVTLPQDVSALATCCPLGFAVGQSCGAGHRCANLSGPPSNCDMYGPYLTCKSNKPSLCYIDGFCDAADGESAANCPLDCSCTQYGNPTGLHSPGCCPGLVNATDNSSPPVPGYGICCFTNNAANGVCLDCGNGICEAGFGEDNVTCPVDCGQQPQVCNAGYILVAGICQLSACDAITVGIDCASLSSVNSGYYCSDGINVDDGNAASGRCCAAGTVWTGASCISTAVCNAVAQCPSAAPISPPAPPNAYYSTTTCVSATANAGSPGACCNVGTKYGTSNYYDYSTSTGVTTNNFLVY